ncbi:uncharacterized protein Smp_201810 [Schistosoma mansoni]|uniref:uncharacterized protein n=1 Tax=Schistosoma mansoni TaxID=6183 RepID=UPI00022DC8C3|nr:uncharacterized protein Smp_201810 [Schistosoma mansoni]|eukprot:XP_018650406.1 uncharacterized protein Smp_201810 [Schistosoma mansoni]
MNISSQPLSHHSLEILTTSKVNVELETPPKTYMTKRNVGRTSLSFLLEQVTCNTNHVQPVTSNRMALYRRRQSYKQTIMCRVQFYSTNLFKQ